MTTVGGLGGQLGSGPKSDWHDGDLAKQGQGRKREHTGADIQGCVVRIVRGPVFNWGEWAINTRVNTILQSLH